MLTICTVPTFAKLRQPIFELTVPCFGRAQVVCFHLLSESRLAFIAHMVLEEVKLSLEVSADIWCFIVGENKTTYDEEQELDVELAMHEHGIVMRVPCEDSC